MRTIINTELAPTPFSPYSQAVKNGNFLFISGLIGQDPLTGKLLESTVEEEMKQLFLNMKKIVSASGFEMQDIIKTTIFVTNFNFYESFNAIYRDYFPEEYPARSTVQVGGLLLGAKIEVEAIAMKR